MFGFWILDLPVHVELDAIALSCNGLDQRPSLPDIMSSYRYLEDCDVHVLDCAGKVDVALGLARLRRLTQELEARPARDGVHRLLIDFRLTEWSSEDAHRELSRATRCDFGLNAENPCVRLAFVLPRAIAARGNGSISNRERWFGDTSEALAWLRDSDTPGVNE